MEVAYSVTELQNPTDPSRARDMAAGPAGPVRIETRLAPSGGQLVICGPHIPRVSVERVEPAAERARREKADARAAAKGKRSQHERHGAARFQLWAHQPDLFSRKPAAVRLTVADATAEMRPRRDFVMRSSFNVCAQVNEREYLLSQVGRRNTQVLRDGRPVAQLRRESAYRPGPRYSDEIEWGIDADHIDVALTHALASAYRVGADGFFVNLLKWVGYGVIAVFSGILGG